MKMRNMLCALLGAGGLMVGWSDGRMVGWADGRMVGSSDRQMVCDLNESAAKTNSDNSPTNRPTIRPSDHSTIKPAPAPATGTLLSGVPWFDQNGVAVNAHGGNVVAADGAWYLFGEWKSDVTNAFTGFSCYSSTNLVDWTFERVALGVQAAGPLGPDRVGERPKVVRTAQGDYVMIMHTDDLAYKDPCLCYAVSQTPAGPYTFVGPLLSDGQPIRKWDMGTFVDDDGTAYLLVHHGEIHRLAPDGRSATRLRCELPEKGGESPAMCRANGLYYLFMSHTTSWERNDNFYFTAPTIEGPWTYRGLFAPKGSLTWNSQCLFVLKVRPSDHYIYIGDRWSYPKQGSCATLVWQPLVFAADGRVSVPDYKEAWDLATGRAVDMAGEPLWKGEGREGTHDVPLANATGRRVYVRADTDGASGYGHVLIKDATGRVLRDDRVDFYSKAPVTNALVYVSPVLGADAAAVCVRPDGSHGVWFKKNGERFGSSGDAVTVREIGLAAEPQDGERLKVKGEKRFTINRLTDSRLKGDNAALDDCHNAIENRKSKIGNANASPSTLRPSPFTLRPSLFQNPPDDVRVGCYYYWVNERVDEAGVRKDLEWMKTNGITRAFLCTDIRNRYRADQPFGAPDELIGDCAFQSETWWRCLRTALRTAGELDIEMGLFNCPGWSQSGGPWVAEGDAQVAPDGSRPQNGPCSPAATGYEVDKTNRAAVRRHFDAFIGEILRRIPAAERPTLTTVVVDSWERGRVVKPEGDPRKLSDIIAEEYMGELTRCAHENGLITWCEPYTHSREGWDADGITYGAAADEVAAEFWADDRRYRAKEMRNALGAARASGKNKVYAESFTAGRWERHAKDEWSFAALKPIADKYFRDGVNATILHVVISQPGDESEPPVRPWFGTFFDRRSRNAAELKPLVEYCRRCNYMLQLGRPREGRTNERILDDGTIIRFTEDSLFEVTDPTGRIERWDPVTGAVAPSAE